MAFLSLDNRSDLPKVSYSTAMDYFVGMCFAFVLASILQFAGVHFFTKHGSGEVFFDSSDEEEDEDVTMKVCLSPDHMNIFCILILPHKTQRMFISNTVEH